MMPRLPRFAIKPSKATIKKVKAAKDKLQATKIAQAKKSRDGTKRSWKRADVDVSSVKTEEINVEPLSCGPEALL